MPRNLTPAAALKLANLCVRMSARSPVPKESTAHHIYVSMPVRYIRQMREILEAEGIDWKADCKEYAKQLRQARRDSKLLGNNIP